MTELKTLAAAIAANADLLECQRGVPFSIAEKLTNIAERLDELAGEIQVNHGAQEENVELRAQVEVLRKDFEDFVHFASTCDGWESFPLKALDNAQELINKTPRQCLAEIRAQAVEAFCKEAANNFSSTKYLKTVLSWAPTYINKIRQQANTGEA